MTMEQSVFIQILADHIHGRCSMPKNPALDWEKLVSYAKKQALTGLVYIQLRDFFKEYRMLLQRLRSSFTEDSIQMYISMLIGKQNFTNFREDAGQFRLVLMKGSVLQSCYPVPVLRSMGDIDIVIHTKDRQKTDEIMLAEGYSKMVDNHAVWTYEKDSIQFEIHDHMFMSILPMM